MGCATLSNPYGCRQSWFRFFFSRPPWCWIDDVRRGVFGEYLHAQCRNCGAFFLFHPEYEFWRVQRHLVFHSVQPGVIMVMSPEMVYKTAQPSPEPSIKISKMSAAITS